MSLIELALALLANTLAQYKAAGAAVGVIQGIEASIAELVKAHGQELTAGNLEGLRVEVPKWS